MANSRWLTSSSWVRLNEFESVWISLSQSFVLNGWIQDGRFHDGCHHQINQIELVWVRVRVEWDCFSVNLREDNKVSESKMAVSESKMAEFMMAAIFKMSQNECMKFYFVQMAESKMVEFKMAAIIKLSQNEWMEFFFVPNGWIQCSRVQDGCHQQINQIELGWVRVRVEWECFWVNLRGDNKVSESTMAVFKMAAIIKLSQN